MNVVVLGLGNLIRKDDGVGIHALHRLSAHCGIPCKVHLVEGGTLGLDLLSAVKGASHLLALDAVDTAAPPGTLSHFADEELNSLPVSKSVHLLGFADLLGALRILEATPSDVVLLGIQPESTDWGLTLSPAVDAALNDFVEAALAQIVRWNHACADAGAVAE